MIDDIKILDTVERYIRGEMNPDERLHFENLRKSNPEIDQLVVEHTLFLQQMNRFGEWKKFKSSLHETHIHLAEQGKINSARLKGKAKVFYLLKRYKRVAAIAAIIAGVTTLTISSLILFVSPKVPAEKFDQLKMRLDKVEKNVNDQNRAINEQNQAISNLNSGKPEKSITYTTGGTGFIIDPKGFLVTNAHVVEGAKNVAIENNRGIEYTVKVVYLDLQKDIAILKIEDENFKPFSSIPYSISKTSIGLAEPIFTLGYPRQSNEIVYGQGYLSAITGFKGDTLSYQIDLSANKGNSGSPIFNKDGEIVGILNGRQTNTEGFAFAIHSKAIFKALDELKKDTSYLKIKIPSASSLKKMEREQQLNKLEDFVFRVKAR